MHSPVGPVAYDCVKVIVVRSGSAILFSEFGQKPVGAGDVVVLSANVLCGSEPEGHITVTTVYLDTDYLVDQVFWQHAGLLQDRLDAQGLVETIYTEPAQALRLGEDRTGMLMPWLDELVVLSIDGGFGAHFYRMQALWFAIIDVVAPFVRVSQVRLSPKQLVRVFADTYGKTPLAYLTMLRVAEMARLLRETNVSVSEAAHQVGWRSRSRASEAFVECTGLTPRRYRTMHVTGTGWPGNGQPCRP